MPTCRRTYLYLKFVVFFRLKSCTLKYLNKAPPRRTQMNSNIINEILLTISKYENFSLKIRRIKIESYDSSLKGEILMLDKKVTAWVDQGQK